MRAGHTDDGCKHGGPRRRMQRCNEDPMTDGAPGLGLRRSVLLALGFGITLWIAASFAIGRSILVASMLEHEREDGLALARRMHGLLDAELVRLDRTSRDWSAWDETWAFARGEADDYVERNVYDGVLANLKLNLMAVVGADGTLRLARGAAAVTGEPRPLPPALLRHLVPGGAWLAAHERDRPLAGLVPGPDGPLAFVAHPIHRSSPTPGERSAGTQVFGRVLGADFIAETRPLLGSQLALIDVARPVLPEDVRAALNAIESRDTPGVDDVSAQPLDADRLAAHALLRDLWGQPVAVLRAITPRTIYADARRAERWLLLASLAVGLAAGLGLYALMARRVLRPLQALDTAVVGLARDGATARVPPVPADDEFARLGRSINALLDEVDSQRDAREARDAAQAASRLKGELLTRIAERTQTPLATLRAALAELLAVDTLDARARDALERAWRAAHGVGATLDEMPDFAWAERSPVPGAHDAVDLRAAVEDVAGVAAARGVQAGRKLVCGVDPDLAPRYYGDGSRLRALLHALLADWPARAAPDDRLVLRARLCERGTDSDSVEVSCSGLVGSVEPSDIVEASRSGGQQLLATELGALLHTTAAGWQLVLRWTRAPSPPAATTPLTGCRCLLVGPADEERDVLEVYLRALGATVSCREALSAAATHEVDLAVCLVDGSDPLPRVGDLPLLLARPTDAPPTPATERRLDLPRPVRWDALKQAATRLCRIEADS